MRTSVAVGAIALAAIVLRPVASRAQEDIVASRGPVTQHTMWKIEDGRKPVYLLGSIHVLRRQNYPLERAIEDAFDDARVVAFEIDIDEAKTAMARPASTGAPAAAHPKRRTLRDGVSTATYRSVVQYLESAGYPGTVFDQLPVSFVASALVQMELAQLGFEPQWGIDAYFYRRARKYGKTIVPMETVEEQVEAMSDLSDKGSDELVQATLQEVAALRTTLRDLIRAWKGGELDKLGALVNGSFSDRPELYQRVMVERNSHWIPKIEALMAGDVPAMVIVGTGHLVGDESVIAMLEAKGHVVTQQ